MPTPRITPEAFAGLVAATGLQLTAEERAEFHRAYAFVEEMAARVRGEGERDAATEPALLFAPHEPAKPEDERPPA
jgi:hypothetical protein